MTEKKSNRHVEYAETGRRIGAWVIDIVIILLITNILMFFFFWATDIPFYFVFQIVAYLIGLFYFSVLESINGQTLGKLIVGLRTVDEDTFEVSTFMENLKNCILKCHWLFCLVDFVIGIIKNPDNPKKKIRLMQNISNTVVIKTR
ncbi:MAG: RDD family protein [Promethearchaeota archaeon]